MRARTSVLALALAASLGTSLSACGGTSHDAAPVANTPAASGTTSGARLLTQQQIDDSLITAHDLGPGFVVDDHQASKKKPDLGCLTKAQASLSDLKKVAAAHRAEAKYRADSRIGAPRVLSSLATYRDPHEISTRMDRFGAAFRGCTHAEGTDANGLHADLAVSLDEKKAGPRVTRQLNLTAFGSATADGITVPVGIRICLIQVGNQAMEVEYLASSEDVLTDSDRLNDLALGRLLDTLAGRTSHPEPLDLHVTTPEELLDNQTSTA